MKIKLTSTLTRIDCVVIDFFGGVCQQSKTASAKGNIRHKQLHYQLEYWISLNICTSSDFLAFELNAIPLSFKSCFRTTIVIFSAGPSFISSIFHSFLSLGLPSISFVASPVSAGGPRFLNNKPGNICLHLSFFNFVILRQIRLPPQDDIDE